MRTLALRFPAGHEVREHRHEWGQVVFAVRGVLRVEALDRQWIVPPLRCLWVPAGVRHMLESIGETWMRTVYLQPDIATDLPPTIGVMEVSPLLRELLLEVARLGVLDSRLDLHRALSTVLLSELGAARESGLALPLPVDARARTLAERVRAAPGQTRSLSALVRGTGASARTAERLFVSQTGMTFGRWRQQARLQHAVRLLAEGVTVANVAFECGYSSVSAFVAMFGRSLGTTPGQYLSRAAPAE